MQKEITIDNLFNTEFNINSLNINKNIKEQCICMEFTRYCVEQILLTTHYNYTKKYCDLYTMLIKLINIPEKDSIQSQIDGTQNDELKIKIDKLAIKFILSELQKYPTETNNLTQQTLNQHMSNILSNYNNLSIISNFFNTNYKFGVSKISNRNINILQFLNYNDGYVNVGLTMCFDYYSNPKLIENYLIQGEPEYLIYDEIKNWYDNLLNATNNFDSEQVKQIISNIIVMNKITDQNELEKQLKRIFSFPEIKGFKDLYRHILNKINIYEKDLIIKSFDVNFCGNMYLVKINLRCDNNLLNNNTNVVFVELIC